MTHTTVHTFVLSVMADSTFFVSILSTIVVEISNCEIILEKEVFVPTP